jgi:hypothetical protein
MTMNVATALAVVAQTLDGTLTEIALPEGWSPSMVGEVWVVSSAAWTFSDQVGGVGFPIAADIPTRIPCNGAALYLAGGAAAQIALFGWPTGT